VSLLDSPSSIGVGSNATLQIMYIADFDSPENQTFYACADIIYVEAADFNIQIPCFNATESDGTSSSHTAAPTSSTTSTAVPAQSGSGFSHDLSGGAIAGIVVGVVVGILVAASLLLYRERKQKNRLRRQLRSVRQGNGLDGQSGKDSISQGSIKLQNLS
jgi:hypothetical protein